MIRHFIHSMVFIAVIGISLTMVSNLFKSKFDKEVFITGNVTPPEKQGFDSTSVDYTGACPDCSVRHK